MVWVKVVTLPQSSVAVHVLTISPQPLTTVLDTSCESYRYIGVAIISCGYCRYSRNIAPQSTVTVAAGIPTSTGASVSVTVMVWVKVVTLPQSSVAVHVLTISPQPLTTVLDTSWKFTGTSVSQLSVAVTAATAGISLQSTVTVGAVEYLPALDASCICYGDCLCEGGHHYRNHR